MVQEALGMKTVELELTNKTWLSRINYHLFIKPVLKDRPLQPILYCWYNGVPLVIKHHFSQSASARACTVP